MKVQTNVLKGARRLYTNITKMEYPLPAKDIIQAWVFAKMTLQQRLYRFGMQPEIPHIRMTCIKIQK